MIDRFLSISTILRLGFGMSSRRQSIQRQIVGPVIGMLAVTVALVSLLCTYLLTGELERAFGIQVERIAKVMRESTFPLTGNVLVRMREISGADFVVWDQAGRISASTFEEASVVEQVRPYLHTHAEEGGISEGPTIRLNGAEYFVKIARHEFPAQDSVMILYPRRELVAANCTDGQNLLELKGQLVSKRDLIELLFRLSNDVRVLQAQPARTRKAFLKFLGGLT